MNKMNWFLVFLGALSASCVVGDEYIADEYIPIETVPGTTTAAYCLRITNDQDGCPPFTKEIFCGYSKPCGKTRAKGPGYGHSWPKVKWADSGNRMSSNEYVICQTDATCVWDPGLSRCLPDPDSFSYIYKQKVLADSVLCVMAPADPE